jgi:hypothetical protein
VSHVARLISAAIAALLLGACTGRAIPPSHSATAWPSGVESSSPATRGTNPLSLATIQRLDARVGFVTGWTGTGLGLARLTDGGASWQRVVRCDM